MGTGVDFGLEAVSRRAGMGFDEPPQRQGDSMAVTRAEALSYRIGEGVCRRGLAYVDGASCQMTANAHGACALLVRRLNEADDVGNQEVKCPACQAPARRRASGGPKALDCLADGIDARR